MSEMDVVLLDADGAPKTLFDFDEPITVQMRYHAREPVKTPNVIVAFMRSDGVGCTAYTTESDGVVFDVLRGDGVIQLRCPRLKLIADKYTVHILIRRQLQGGSEELLWAQMRQVFHVRHHLYDKRFGVYHEGAQWTLMEDGELAMSANSADGALP